MASPLPWSPAPPHSHRWCSGACACQACTHRRPRPAGRCRLAAPARRPASSGTRVQGRAPPPQPSRSGCPCRVGAGRQRWPCAGQCPTTRAAVGWHRAPTAPPPQSSCDRREGGRGSEASCAADQLAARRRVAPLRRTPPPPGGRVGRAETAQVCAKQQMCCSQAAAPSCSAAEAAWVGAPAPKQGSCRRCSLLQVSGRHRHRSCKGEGSEERAEARGELECRRR